MANIFLNRPTLVEHATRIANVGAHGGTDIAVTLAENIVRSDGGGQPEDWATLDWRGRRLPVIDVVKAEGETWLVLGSVPDNLSAGDEVTVAIDGERRSTLTRYHTLAHVLQASARQVIEGHASRGADIRRDAGAMEVRFSADASVTASQVAEIDRRARSAIAAGLAVTAQKARSPEEAAARFPHWRIDPDLGLRGKIRVIDIENLDSNACSGTHVSNTAEIGPFSLLKHTVGGDGLNHLSVRLDHTWMYWYGPD